jgi:protein-S-isoprenylcysteine O-methyltransferase Ste14
LTEPERWNDAQGEADCRFQEEVDMERWKRYIQPVAWGAWTVLLVSQIILAFFFNVEGIRALRHIGWIIWAVGAVFGWVPIFTFRRKGGVPKGKSYVKTTVLVDSGIYAVVRHPQYLAGILLSLALILITQHWLIMIIGAASIALNYIDILIADQDCIEKFGDDYKRYMERVPRTNFLLGFIRLLQSRKGE